VPYHVGNKGQHTWSGAVQGYLLAKRVVRRMIMNKRGRTYDVSRPLILELAHFALQILSTHVLE